MIIAEISGQAIGPDTILAHMILAEISGQAIGPLGVNRIPCICNVLRAYSFQALEYAFKKNVSQQV